MAHHRLGLPMTSRYRGTTMRTTKPTWRFGPRQTGGGWHAFTGNPFLNSGGPIGASADIPVVGDSDGDGMVDPTTFRGADGSWTIVKSTSGYTSSFAVSWGVSGDVPLPKRP